MITEKLLKLVVGVFVSGLVARHLSPDGFGQLNYALALLSIFITVSSLGLNRIIVRYVVELAELPQQRLKVISTAFTMRFVTSVVIFLVLVLMAIFLLNDSYLLYIVVFASLLFSPLDVVDLYQQGLSEVKKVSLIRFYAMIISAVFKIFFVIADLPLIFFATAVLIEYFIIALMLFLFFKTTHSISLFSVSDFSYSKSRKFLHESWPEILAGLGAIMFMRLDQIMLSSMRGAESVGIYSAAVRLSEAWYFLPTVIVAASFPFIIRGKSYSLECYQARLRLLITALLVVATTAALLVTFLSDWAIELIYGMQYKESATILLIHCWSGLFVCMGISSGSALAAEKKLRWNLYRNFFGLVVNIILNIYLISKYGAVGAAIATLVSLASAFWLFDLLFPALRYMFFLKLKSINFFYLLNILRLKRIANGF